MKRKTFWQMLILLLFSTNIFTARNLSANESKAEITGELRKWHKITLTHQTPPMNTSQRLAGAEYFHQNDPYRHHIVIHNPPAFDDILEPEKNWVILLQKW